MTTEQTTSSKKLLITGGSGFISIETIKQALEARHQVRTTIRSQSKQKIIIDALTSRSIDVSNLSFIQTDLLKDENWSQACKDIEIVLHIASPFPSSSPKNQDELIKPAVEGTLRVLKAAKEQKVKKVVVTSSIAAICFGNEWKNKVFTEEDWSDLNGGEGTAYLKSKTLAEKAVWEFYGNQTVESGDGNGDANGEDYKMEIAVVNPAAVFGPPIIVPSESTTVGIIQQMLSGKMPIAVDLSFGVVDVRDVASLHLLVAFSSSSNGQRYICSLETLSLAEIGRILQTLPDGKGSKAPTRNLPNPLVKILSYVLPQLKGNVGGLGKRRNLSNQKAKDLGWNPRDEKETILSCAKALIDAGVV